MTHLPLYRLAAHTLAEPLISHWPAWWLTAVPLPSALHLQAFQVPLLKAYLQAPDFHAKAAQDLAAAGTAFVGVPAARAGEVRALLQRMQSEQAHRIKLAEAVEELQTWLLAEARGQSLEPLYPRIPEPLRGMVELIYDYNNRPFIRLIRRGSSSRRSGSKASSSWTRSTRCPSRTERSSRHLSWASTET